MKGGIDIRHFELLSTEKEFLEACHNFKSFVKGDDDARSFTELENLNPYKGNHKAFIDKVGDALEYMKIRKRNRALRKSKKVDGVNLVYEDENCFIVSPDGPESSHKAAYLDHGKANWCIAVKDTAKCSEMWKSYKADVVFYIYEKGGESWVVILDAFSIYLLKNSLVGDNDIPFAAFESRANANQVNIVGKRIDFKMMLKNISLSQEKFNDIILKYTLNLPCANCIIPNKLIIENSIKRDCLAAFKICNDFRHPFILDSIKWEAKTIFEFLLEHGKEPPPREKSWLLNIAEHGRHPFFVTRLLKRYGSCFAKTQEELSEMYNPFYFLEACCLDHDCVQFNLAMCFKYGANPNLPLNTYHNETALHLTAKWANIRAATLLIENGADVNARDKDGRTPMHYLYYFTKSQQRFKGLLGDERKRKHMRAIEEMYELLKLHGADETLVDRFGVSGKENVEKLLGEY